MKTDYTKPASAKEKKQAKEPVKEQVKESTAKVEASKPKRKAKKKCVVTANKLYLRSAPTKANNVIKILSKGFKLVLEENVDDTWCKVTFDNGGVVGYVMKQFISIV